MKVLEYIVFGEARDNTHGLREAQEVDPIQHFGCEKRLYVYAQWVFVGTPRFGSYSGNQVWRWFPHFDDMFGPGFGSAVLVDGKSKDSDARLWLLRGACHMECDEVSCTGSMLSG